MAKLAGAGLLLAGILLTPTHANGAQFEGQQMLRTGGHGLTSYVQGSLSKAKPKAIDAQTFALAFITAHKTSLGLTNPAAQLRLLDANADRVGGQHVAYQQLQDGVPVWGTVISVHMDKNGIIRSVNSELHPNLKSNTQGLLTEAAMKKALTQNLGADLAQMGTPKLFVRTISADKDIIAYQVPVWMNTTAADKKVIPVSLWVDAKSAEPLFGENPLRHDTHVGTGVTVDERDVDLDMYDGRDFRLKVSPILRPYVQSAEKGAFNLVDQSTRDNGWIYTWDCNETYMLNCEYVNSPDDSFDAANDIGHPAGVSGHHNARRTVDYYDQRFNRRGLDDNGLSVASLVQIDDGIPSYPLEINAAWAGYGFNFMIYGAGGEWPQDSGTMWRPFSVSLDVIGHEFNHAVNEFTVNLGYEHESGAMNEHLADVFGVTTQAYYEGLDWLMGEQLFEEPAYPYDAVRSFEDPTLYNQPDRMSIFRAEPLSYDAGGVHFNSGIANKAFYMAVVGGAFNGVVVPPLDSDPMASLEIAEELWYDVMVNRRINPNSQLIDLRYATIDAAASLSPESQESLRRAWDSVEVTDAFYPDSTVDTVEPNDYKGLATTIAVGEEKTGYIWNRGDCDMFALEGDGDVNIVLGDLPTSARLAVYKAGLFGILSEVASSDQEELMNEVIHMSLRSGTTYYIEVMVDAQGQGSTSDTYTLRVQEG